MRKLLFFAVILCFDASYAMAGCEKHKVFEIDCPTKSPSQAPINANDRMRGHFDEGQWERWNSGLEAEQRAAESGRAQARADRAQAAQERANLAYERSANASAAESASRAMMMDRMYRPRPFQSGY